MAEIPKWAEGDGGAWWNSRPAAVQAILTEFPPSRRIIFGPESRVAYVIGVAEVAGGGEPMLKLSWIDPREDYARASTEHFHVHPAHMRADAN